MTGEGPRFPNIKVELSAERGDQVDIIGRVRNALRENAVSVSLIDEFIESAASGDRDHLMAVCQAWVTVT